MDLFFFGKPHIFGRKLFRTIRILSLKDNTNEATILPSWQKGVVAWSIKILYDKSQYLKHINQSPSVKSWLVTMAANHIFLLFLKKKLKACVAKILKYLSSKRVMKIYSCIYFFWGGGKFWNWHDLALRINSNTPRISHISNSLCASGIALRNPTCLCYELNIKPQKLHSRNSFSLKIGNASFQRAD